MTNDIFNVGAGLLNVSGALASQELMTGSAVSPTAVYSSANGVSLHTIL